MGEQEKALAWVWARPWVWARARARAILRDYFLFTLLTTPVLLGMVDSKSTPYLDRAYI